MAISPTSFNKGTSGVQRWGKNQYGGAAKTWTSEGTVSSSATYYPTGMLGASEEGPFLDSGNYWYYWYVVTKFRVKFTTDAAGCSKLTWKLSSASGQYTSNSYAYAVTSSTSTPSSWTSVTAAQETAKQGDITVKLLPNTVYYFWMKMDGNYGCDLGNLTLTGSGVYGAPGNITANNAEFGSAVTMSYASATSGATYTVTTSVPKTGGGTKTETLQTKNSTSSRTWTPAVSTYGPLITDAKSVTCTITVQTYFGDELAGTKTKTITLTFGSALAPTLSSGAFSIAPNNTGAVAGKTGYIQGYSKITASFTANKATYMHSATFSKFTVKFGSATAVDVTSTSSTATSTAVSATTSVVCTLVDSRGFTASQTLTATITPYTQPALPKCEVYRCDQDGTPASDGTYFMVDVKAQYASVEGQNSATVNVAYVQTGSSYGSGTDLSNMTITTVGTNKTAEKAQTFGTIQDIVYNVRVKVTDALNNTFSSEFKIPTDAWVIHTRKFSGGFGIGLGKAAENVKRVETPDDWGYYVGTSPVVTTQNGQGLTDLQKSRARANIGAGTQEALTFDSSPTANSTNPVTSGGIKSAILAAYIVEDVSVDNTTLAGNTYTTTSIACGKTGYAAIGVAGFSIRSASSSGANAQFCVVRSCFLGGTSTVTFDWRNIGSNQAKVKLTAYILYRKA